jgi:galactokinase
VAGPPSVLIEAFKARFRKTPEVFRAPGRVNLIGEHTDYNLGFVLPIAIDLACYAAAAPNGDGVLRLQSLNQEPSGEWPIEQLPELPPSGNWTDYVIGVARQMPQTHGRDILIYGTVPTGAGLSSSASLEVSAALALGWDLAGRSKLELAKLCRRAENDFVGLPSGIMDQYASVFGREGAAIKIDCRSLESEAVELPDGAEIVAADSMVKHALGQSAYRQRVAECARAVAAIREKRREVESLRDATADDLAAIQDPVAMRRARHVIAENDRVLKFVSACRRRDLTEMGRLFVESHQSLRDDYEVSCAELDFLVETATSLPGVFGARMTGGGFGGCTVNLLRPGAKAGFEKSLGKAYQARFGLDPHFYAVSPSSGAEKIS